MNDQSIRHVNPFNPFTDAQIPEVVKELAAGTVTKARTVYDTAQAAAKNGGKTAEAFWSSAGSGARIIGSKVLDNIAANTEAMFEAAQTIARAETVPEAVQLQAKFVQQQFVTAGEQTREMLDLYAQLTANALDSLHRVANTGQRA